MCEHSWGRDTRGDQSHLLDDALVGVEVKVELGVVLLDDHSHRLLDGIGPDAAHPGGRFFCKVVVGLERGEDKEAATRRREQDCDWSANPRKIAADHNMSAAAMCQRANSITSEFTS